MAKDLDTTNVMPKNQIKLDMINQYYDSFISQSQEKDNPKTFSELIHNIENDDIDYDTNGYISSTNLDVDGADGIIGLAKYYDDESKFGLLLPKVEPKEDEETVNNAAKASDVAMVIIGRTAGEDKDFTDSKEAFRLSEIEEDMTKRQDSSLITFDTKNYDPLKNKKMQNLAIRGLNVKSQSGIAGDDTGFVMANIHKFRSSFPAPDAFFIDSFAKIKDDLDNKKN